MKTTSRILQFFGYNYFENLLAPILTKVKFAAKKLYYQDKLEISKNNTSEVRCIIKSLLSSSRSNSSLPHKLKHNNTFTTNPTLIANSFNDYFSGIGKILADQLKPSSKSEHT